MLGLHDDELHGQWIKVDGKYRLLGRMDCYLATIAWWEQSDHPAAVAFREEFDWRDQIWSARKMYQYWYTDTRVDHEYKVTVNGYTLYHQLSSADSVLDDSDIFSEF